MKNSESCTPATITIEEEKALSSALRPEYSLLLRFILETGCTISEVCAIEWPDKALEDNWKYTVLHDTVPRIENFEVLQLDHAVSGKSPIQKKNIYNYGSGFALTLSLSLLSDEPEAEEKPGKKQGPKGIIPVHVYRGRKKRGSGRSVPRTVFCSRSLLTRIMKQKVKETELTEESATFEGAEKNTGVETLFSAPAGCSLSRERVSMHLIRISERVLDKRVTPAALRHTCAARLFNGGADISLVCRYLGHSAPSVTAGLYYDTPGFPLPHGAPVKGYNDPWTSKLCRYLRSHRPV